MAQHYHNGLVLVSLVVAILASYTALTFAMRIRLAGGMAARAWLIGGGFAMGIGIWAMHFIGMLALTLPIQISYEVWTTLASMAIAVLVSSFALHIASRPMPTGRKLVAAGLAMGTGICAMHYVGMAAIEITPPIRYQLSWVAASFGIAIAASFAALGLAFTTHEDTRWWRYRLALGAVLMGLAITGMHYAGMAAAQFPGDATTNAGGVVNRAWLAGAVTIVTAFVLLGALLLSLLEAQSAARTARMQAIVVEATASNRAKDEFLAMLGHELRNPLASIANAVVLIDRAPAHSPDWKLARDVIARQAAHLGRIVDDLLDVGRAVAGKMSLHMEPLNLHRAVRQALGALEASGKTAGRDLRYEGRPCWVRADRTRIEQVVTNLVANAVQHTSEGGRIAVEVRCDEAEVILSVSDDGEGMDPDTALRAFELFYQAHDPSRPGKGLGIGLALVRRIVELHGGGVSVESSGPGTGAVFTARLPRIAAPGRAQREEERRVAPRPARSVVLVEDAADARSTLHRLLEAEGHSVCIAADGESGLRAILERTPDVAIVDIGLPGLDGYEIARRARSAGTRAYLIALTGYGLAEDRLRAIAAGFDVHLTKPAEPANLLKLIAQVRA